MVLSTSLFVDGIYPCNKNKLPRNANNIQQFRGITPPGLIKMYEDINLKQFYSRFKRNTISISLLMVKRTLYNTRCAVIKLLLLNFAFLIF